MIDKNTKEYWDSYWKKSKSRVELYSCRLAWWEISQTQAKSVLDIGCGTGKLLCNLKSKYTCFGVDISEVAIKKLKQRHGVDGLVLNANNIEQLQKKFDFIVANHILEHIPDDELFLQKCRNLVNPGGTIFITVPNNCSYPEETGLHFRKYDASMLRVLMEKVFGNCQIRIRGHHLAGVATL